MPTSDSSRIAARMRIGCTVAMTGLALLASRMAAQIPDSSNAARSGVYRSAESFTKGTLDFAVECPTGTHRIDRHLLLSRPYLDIAHDGVRTRINKRDIFGFRDCDGSVVRYVDGSEYAILSAGIILMYARSVMVPSGNREGYRIMPVRYFSLAASDTLIPLTRVALKNAFPANHELHDALDATFRTDDELGAFDGRHGVYRLQRMLTRFVGATQVRE